MTRKLPLLVVAFVLLFLFAGCSMPSTNGITQVATIDALLAGVYDGHMSLQALRRFGDFGLGTYESLDGEMLLLDGVFYKVKYDGTVEQPLLAERTPFAAVTRFVATYEETIQNPVDLPALDARIDAIVPEQNLSVAFIVRGNFSRMQTRSVPGQAEPYPPLAEVTKHQAVFDFADVNGVMVGFRLPAFVAGVNVPGYHMHFLTEDLSAGGHVLDFELRDGTLEMDTLHDWLHIYFPTDSDAFGAADLTQDRTEELDAVENNPQADTQDAGN
jgi:acetolactate decarboxylase